MNTSALTLSCGSFRRCPDRQRRSTSGLRCASLPAVLALSGALYAASACAALSAEELAKMAQNPVGAMISVPFQNNTNFNVGPLSGTQNILNIQPVIPITVNKDWNVITRTILPLIWQPEFVPGQGSTFGLGDIQFSAFLSPAEPGPGGLIWGAGAIVQMPTNTDDVLGNKNWGLGPTAVVLKLEHGNPWVYGVLVNNVWSLSSSKQGGSYNNLLLQPFLNYNFPGGVYFTSSPVITANWNADSSERWTVPIGKCGCRCSSCSRSRRARRPLARASVVMRGELRHTTRMRRATHRVAGLTRARADRTMRFTPAIRKPPHGHAQPRRPRPSGCRDRRMATRAAEAAHADDATARATRIPATDAPAEPARPAALTDSRRARAAPQAKWRQSHCQRRERSIRVPGQARAAADGPYADEALCTRQRRE